MHSATTATSRTLPPSGKTVASASAALPPTAFFSISNRNTAGFKNPRNPMKIKAASLSNRNTNTLFAHRPQLEAPGLAECAVCARDAVTGQGVSNRHTPRLENAISHRKQTTASHSNRHFLQVSECHQRRTADAHCPPKIASNIVSNRQWQILEINVNLSKQTIALRSNRHKNAFIKYQKSGVAVPPCRERYLLSGGGVVRTHQTRPL